MDLDELISETETTTDIVGKLYVADDGSIDLGFYLYTIESMLCAFEKEFKRIVGVGFDEYREVQSIPLN